MDEKRIRLCLLLVLATLLMPVPSLVGPSAAADDDGPSGPWSLPVRVDSGPKATGDISSVRLVMDGSGNLFVGWLEDRDDGNDCFVAASFDGGETWKDDVRVDPFPNSARTLPTTCDIEVDDSGHLFAAYTQRILQGWRVRFARSDDDGQSFRTPTNVHDVVDPTEVQEHPEMAVSAHGAVYILFLDRTSSPTPASKLYLVRSDDGLNVLPPRAVEPDQPTDVAHVQGDIAVTEDGAVYVAYGYRETGEAGIKVGRKEPAEGTFTITKALVIEEDEPRELRPRLAVHDGEVIEIIYDPLDGEGRLKHIRSEDSGSTFSSPSIIWAPGAVNDVQTNPDIAFDDLGRLNVVWTQGGDAPGRVYHSLSHDGVSFTSPTELNGAWNSSEMGLRSWEDHAAILPLSDGSLIAAFAARLNNTGGVFLTRLVNEPPVVTIDQPADGGHVRGRVRVVGTADDPGGTSGLASVYVKVGDDDPVRIQGATSWQHEFDSTEIPDGWINISAWGWDGFLQGPPTMIGVDVDNNVPPQFSIGTPANGTTHLGVVRVAGTSFDPEGFNEGWKVQYSLDAVNWTDIMGGVLLDENNMDYEIELDLRDRPSGSVQIYVRVSDGDKYSQAMMVLVNLDNRPDLYIDPDSVVWEPLNPKHDDPVSFTLRVENLGVVTSERYEVELKRGSQTVGLAEGSNLPAGEGENILVEWDARGGNNSLKFIVDSMYSVDELDETNNELLINVIVKRPKTDDEESSLPRIGWIIGATIAFISIGYSGIKWYLLNRPPPPEPIVETVYEGGGLYDEAGPYGEDQMTDAGKEPPGDPGQTATAPEPPDRVKGAPEPDLPTMDAKDDTQLTQDVTIRTEKVERG